TVNRVLEKLVQTGDIYEKEYSGWYCTPCESFWTELQLLEGKCPDCRREVQRLQEKNYFFKLSQHQEWLVKKIQDDKDFIQPEMRRNEILGFLRQPLEDLCITRPKARLSWGIPFAPNPEFVVYVWFDALINYISAIGYLQDAVQFAKYWPADLHVVGKDILRQHAVYWPIMLKACGLPMPKTLLAHGWWTMGGDKVSKSRGNIVDPMLLTEKYGNDAFRYFLLHEVTLGNDGAFSEDLFQERYRTALANDLGNLWHRYASMLGKYFQGIVPDVDLSALTDFELVKMVRNLLTKINTAMKDHDPRLALDLIWEVLVRGNQFVEEQKPWVLAKDPAKTGDLKLAMAALGDALSHTAVVLQSFLPVSSAAILSRLGLPVPYKHNALTDFDQIILKAGTLVERGEPLFPKLEDEAEVKE
ncbi:MAG: methionine--tRNA ligase, partial [Candidatus Omnitrophica bacterium]|nr:methionine--tRNA ligase [Candidatus Omnitrophota bacterium]